METSWKAIAEGVLESGWLVALATVPVYFNTQSMNVFEGDKTALLRSVALMTLPFLAVWLLETRGQRKEQAAPLWRVPLVKPALLFGAILSVATVVSMDPRLSFIGSYTRMQGLYTWLCYLLIFLPIVLLARKSGQVHRVVDALLLASLASSLYGVLQYAGLDPVPYTNRFGGRVTGTLGNPIFLGAFLVMVIPLTVARAWGHARRLIFGDVNVLSHGKRAALFSIAVYVLLLSIQMAAFLLSASRGPFFAFAAGTGFFLLILVVRSHRRWLARSICIVAMLILVILAAWALGGARLAAPHGLQDANAYVSRQLARRGTVAVRLLIWESAGKLFLSNPARMILGYGPETIYYTFPRVFPSQLASIENPGDSPDRCHNETFDSLLMTGVLGLAAEIGFLLSLLSLLLRRLGVVNSRSEVAALISISCLGGAAGWFVPYMALGSLQLSGLGLPAGILAGIAGFLLIRAGWGKSHPPLQLRRHDLLLFGLFVGIIAHFVETQLGIATVTTRLCFWAFAGLAGALVYETTDANTDSSARGRKSAATKGRNKQAEKIKAIASNWQREVIIGTLVGLIMLVITYGLYLPELPMRSGSILAFVCLAVWILGAALARERIRAREAKDSSGSVTFRYAAASFGPWLLFAAVYIPWMHSGISTQEIKPELLAGFVVHLANGVTILYLFVFVILGWTAYLLFEGRGTVARGSWWKIAALAVSLPVCCAIVQRTNLDFSRAEVVVKEASGHEKNGNWDIALVLRSESLRLQPEQRQYRRDMAYAMIRMARNVADFRLGRRLLAQARSYLFGLWQENDAAFDVAWYLANLYRSWALLDADASEAASLRSEAERYYGTAILLFPCNASIFNDWAAYYLEQGEPAEALDRLRQSLNINDRLYDTHILRGKAHAQEHSYSLALADYERALVLAPESADASEGRAAMLRQLQLSEKARHDPR